MSRLVRPWLATPLLMGLLGGCVPSSGGPSIPSGPRPAATTRQVTPQPFDATKAARSTKKQLGRRNMGKVQATPKLRNPALESEAR